MKKKLFILSFLVAGLILFACKKDNSTTSIDQVTENELTATSQNEAFAQMAFEGIDQIADEAYAVLTNTLKSGQNNASSLLGPCATKTLDTLALPHVLTINFGNVNCLCNDGKYRRGLIIISFTGHYRDSAAVHNTTLSDFYVNDNHIMGNRSRLNNGRNAAGHFTVSTVINSSIAFYLSGDTLVWNTSQTKEWLHGYWSPNFIDDAYLITGSSNGLKPNGISYTKTILTPLKRVYSCNYFVSGSVQLIQSNRPTRIIDYGNGQCNPWATLTVNGVTHTIHL